MRAIRFECLDAVVSEVGDPNVAFGVELDEPRLIELSKPTPATAEHGLEGPIR